jgi:hypothetical protein
MESFVFYFTIQKFKDEDIQNYNFRLLLGMGVKLGR